MFFFSACPLKKAVQWLALETSDKKKAFQNLDLFGFVGQLLDFDIFSFFWFLGFYFVCALTCIPWGGFWLDDYPPPPLPPSFFTESAHALGRFGLVVAMSVLIHLVPFPCNFF